MTLQYRVRSVLQIDERINKSVIASVIQLAERQAGKIPTSSTAQQSPASVSQPASAGELASKSGDLSGAVNAKNNSSKML